MACCFTNKVLTKQPADIVTALFLIVTQKVLLIALLFSLPLS